MSGLPPIRERPGGSRIDDLGPTAALLTVVDASTSAHPGPGPMPADFDRSGPHAVEHLTLGAPAPLAGFDPSTTGRFSGVHRGVWKPWLGGSLPFSMAADKAEAVFVEAA